MATTQLKQNLYGKLINGVTIESLSTDEYWLLRGLESSDHLYDTHYVTYYRRQEDGFITIDRNTDGQVIYRAGNQNQLYHKLVLGA